MIKLVNILLSLFLVNTNSLHIDHIPTVMHLSTSIADKSFFCADASPFILNVLKNDINKEYIKQLSGLLPQADIISKKVLEWNDIWIERIIDSRNIPEDFKKTLILELINFVQNGDNTGGAFLEWYKETINCLLP